MQPNETDLASILALTLVPGLGPRLTQALLDRFGSADAACRASAEELRSVPHIGAKLATNFAAALRAADPQAELKRAAQYGIDIVPRTDPRYPGRLRDLPDSPHVLYVRGKFTPADVNAVAIVGSRQCTSYGTKVASRLAAALARAGYTVISGLALGIDGAAHRGALEAGGRTIGVLAGGLSSIYPPDHVALGEQIAKQCALVTETPITMNPQRGMFHARNRLISGLSLAVVIIEANLKSGALITARHAADQGRDVFVVPANVDSSNSAGSLKLLRDGARLIRDADDLIDDLRGLRVTPPTARPAPASEASAEAVPPPPTLDGPQQKVWDLLTEPRHMDELIRGTGLPIGELSKVLILMQGSKAIRQLAGNLYERR